MHDVIWGRRSTTPLILNLDTKMAVSGQLHAPAALPAVPTEQKVGWAPEPDLNYARNSEVRTVSGGVFLTSGSATFCSVRVAKQGGVPKTPTDGTVHTKSEVAACTPHRFRKPLIFI